MTLSEQLYLLFEGAITASQLHGEPWPAKYARQAAEKLLAAGSLEPRPSAKKNKEQHRGSEAGLVALGSGRFWADRRPSGSHPETALSE
jgi:hypothetical protein